MTTTTTVHPLLESPPCARCAGETCAVTDAPAGAVELHGRAPFHGERYCYCCGATGVAALAVVAGPAGHWWAYSERFGVLLCKPQSKGETDPPAHPDTLAGDEYADREWGESEVIPPATVRALVLLTGRDPDRTVPAGD